METFLGFFVLLIVTGLTIFAFSHFRMFSAGCVLNAPFDRADGLVVGSDVRINGVKVGEVVEMDLEPQTYRAIVTFRLAPGVALPSDSVAEISGVGLIDHKFLSLVPGSNAEKLKPFDTLHYTKSALSIESLVGRFLFK